MKEIMLRSQINHNRIFASIMLPAACLLLNFVSPCVNAIAQDPAKPTRQPYNPEAVKHYNKGLDLHHAGFLNKAIEEYQAALAKDDRLEQAYSNLGLIYTAQKNYLKATEAFDKALALKPDRATSLNGLASVLYARKQFDAAIEKWKRALELNPRFASAYFNMGTAYESESKFDEALSNYWKSIEMAPDMGEAYYRLGSLLNKMKHPAQAEVMLTRFVEIEPESETAREARKQLLAISNAFRKEDGIFRRSRLETLKEKPVKVEESEEEKKKREKEEKAAKKGNGGLKFGLGKFGKKNKSDDKPNDKAGEKSEEKAGQNQKMRVFQPFGGAQPAEGGAESGAQDDLKPAGYGNVAPN
jgi:tetratricopeptide (TPR) repeat protein